MTSIFLLFNVSELILESIEEEISSKMFMNESKVWQCTECGRESKYKTDITRHVESLHILDHPGYECSYCGRIIKSKDAFKRHISTKHPLQ